ncbi:pyridoxamine 5'-phosphate oxidase family protein [Myceligenerans sp. I2]|uniref:Pyridoxamine 5'-phosphate oxidase family protein n=2 Tax=Myceligenerans indicum TaxID=2593663 RepID=A0ABS1LEX8_9MICO|nr:pyridoxamine 5'-phosphate oxidase family protein [Myceligenerans indicum]
MSQWTSSDPITTLGDEESWDLLSMIPIGRLATAVAGEADIFPVNFAVADREIYINTTPGSKLVEAVVNPKVAFEVDQWGPDFAYSVVVKGTVKILETEAELTVAEGTGLVTYTATDKTEWLRLTPTSVSGRRFTRAERDD